MDRQQDGIWTPPRSVVDQAHVKDYDKLRDEAGRDLEKFWEQRAKTLEWFAPWKKVLDASKAPFYQWFVGGKTNIVHNAIDRHLKTATRNKLAFIWEGEDGTVKTYSYHRLNREVCQFAAVLRSMGVKKGDRVTIYLPRIPELPIAMLACAKIGAVHSVVYGGFSVEALHGRIEDSESKVVVTADGGYMRGKIVPLKQIADEAAKRTGVVEHMIVVKRTGENVPMEPERDYYYHELAALPGARRSGNEPTEVMDAEDPLFMLYTSGTTGKPKAILHTHGGYQVGVSTTLEYCLDIKPDDRYWCAADPGWITGHSYIVYGPLMLGATSIIYEGAPTHPYPDRWWKIVETYGVNILYTAPTAIRGLMRFGDSWPNRRDLSSLRLLGSVGEPINPEAWRWYHRVVGKDRCPIIDTWWQTETGMFMIAPVPSFPLKPGSGTKPFPGIKAEVLDEDGEPVKAGEEGKLVITTPWPAMMRTIYKDPERYVKQYWSTFPGKYFTGDSARIDADGYFWIIGRVDDVIKVSGYRLGTAEIESALVSHSAVSEAAAIGIPHDVKGNVIYSYVMLKAGQQPSPELAQALVEHVGHEVGPIARPEKVEFVAALPKTRSGKIMRRVLKARAQGLPEGDLSTLEE
ncbi:MAG TPA: acetate--CoA ligase [Candidatus Polarisedimenticolaceae bacterium]|nr:acetate--CoA ligase [Candidatus Polarisedimenticolaceae bacterium]